MATAAAERVGAAIARNPLWYHTLELAPGVVTPGWFDLRPVLERLPWPDLRGKRCLDVGTYDGQLAFAAERRGAAEVIATDIAGHEDWDWPPDMRARGPAELARLAGESKGIGFEIARDALGSSVRRECVSVYEIGPERLGSFDVVLCGSLLLHLREPLRALEAIRSVCRGSFLSAEQIELGLSLRHPRRPLARLNGSGELCQWWTPNAAGHRRMIYAAGFAIERATAPYVVPFGPAHPRGSLRERLTRQSLPRLLAGGTGVPHAAVLARPRV